MLRLVIMVKGGLVEEVLSSDECEYLIIDQDVCGDDEEREVRDTRGNKFVAAIGFYEEPAHPHAVEHYFEQYATAPKVVDLPEE